MATSDSQVIEVSLSCDDGLAADAAGGPRTPVRTHPWARVATDAQIAQALVDLNDIVDSGIAAFGGNPAPSRNYEFVPAPPLESSRKQGILILEGSNGLPSAALGRYKNRVMGIYDFPNAQTPHLMERFPIEKQSSIFYRVGSYLAELSYHIPVC